MKILSSLNQRDKAILVGLFLSKFDRQALDGFGFKGFNEAYNVLGYALDINPNSIKNYRDELTHISQIQDREDVIETFAITVKRS